MKKPSKVLSGLLAGCLVLALAACSGDGQTSVADPGAGAAAEAASGESGGDDTVDAGSKYGGVVKLSYNVDLVSLGYPGNFQTSQEQQTTGLMVESLGRYDESGTLVPWLAESYEEDPQALTLTVKLREGITFHDGTPFNAEAVKWNWEEFTAAGKSELAGFESIQVVDEYTVVATLGTWNNAIADYALYSGGYMVSPTYVQENGVDAARNHPVGTGPFRFAQWERDVKLVVEKNDNYWVDGLPYLDGFEIHFIQDDTTIISAMRSGEIDGIIQAGNDVVAAMQQDGLEPISQPLSGGISIVGLFYDSVNEGPTTSLEVRQAIAHAIDFEAIAGMFVDTAMVEYTNQWAAPSAWSYNSDVVGYPYDTERAKALLAEAGYTDGVEVPVYYIDGQPWQTALPVAQAMAAEAGITLRLEPIDQARQDEMGGIGGSWGGIIASAGRIEADIAPIYARTFKADGVRYVGGMLHPADLVAAIDNATGAFTFEEKVAYTQQASKMIIDDYCQISPLYTSSQMNYAADYVRDSHLGWYHAVLWTPEECYIAQ